jgi:hypothetical protein
MAEESNMLRVKTLITFILVFAASWTFPSTPAFAQFSSSDAFRLGAEVMRQLTIEEQRR